MSAAPGIGLVGIKLDGDVAIVTLNRPDKLNAFNMEMVGQLAAVCQAIERSEDVRVVVLVGEGKAFSSGGDVEAWGALSALDFGRHWLRQGHAAFDALARLRQPVIAVLNGHALGGGLEVAALADLRVAEEHAKIGLPETGIGVLPGWSGTQRCVRRFGPQIVRRMAVFGEVFTAKDALALGIVDHVVPRGEGLSHALEIARRTAARAPVATEVVKMLVNAAEGEERERAMEAIAGIAVGGTADLSEGIAAFTQKRQPDFTGR